VLNTLPCILGITSVRLSNTSVIMLTPKNSTPARVARTLSHCGQHETPPRPTCTPRPWSHRCPLHERYPCFMYIGRFSSPFLHASTEARIAVLRCKPHVTLVAPAMQFILRFVSFPTPSCSPTNARLTQLSCPPDKPPQSVGWCGLFASDGNYPQVQRTHTSEYLKFLVPTA